jgi:hypothetical protein
MLIEAAANTYRILQIRFGDVEYFVTPGPSGEAFVPPALGMELARAKMARVVDQEAEPPGDAWLFGDRYAPWVIPAWPTRH